MRLKEKHIAAQVGLQNEVARLRGGMFGLQNKAVARGQRDKVPGLGIAPDLIDHLFTVLEVNAKGIAPRHIDLVNLVGVIDEGSDTRVRAGAGRAGSGHPRR